ncbi:MAG: hypothetical protein ABFE01_23690 [Phycisphaerales bacterium]
MYRRTRPAVQFPRFTWKKYDFGTFSIKQMKDYLAGRGVPVRR